MVKICSLNLLVVCLLIFETSLFSFTIACARSGNKLKTESDNLEFKQMGGSVVGAFVFPHGAITLDPEIRDFHNVPANTPTSQNESILLHVAMKKAADELLSLKPDLIIMSTPHGLRLQNHFLFAGNIKASGSAEWDGDWTDFTADINIDGGITKNLVEMLRTENNTVELLTVGSSDKDSLNLRWGEVIPWWFINEAYIKAELPPPPLILMGQPTKRLLENGTEKMIPELMKLGSDVGKFILHDSAKLGRKQRIAIVISCDLSHYHSKDPTSPYEYSEFAQPFDDFVVSWSKMDMKKEDLEKMKKILVEDAGGLVDRIGSCGYTGLVFLQGIMNQIVNETDGNYKSHSYHYAAPTYYGMLSSGWIL